MSDIIRANIQDEKLAAKISERDGALLLHRAAADARRFANMHELPTAALAGFDDARVMKVGP